MALPAASAAVLHPAPDLWTQLQLLVVNSGLRMLLGIVILILGWSLAGWAKRGLARGLAHLPLDPTLKPLIASLARYGILILTLLLVIGNFGIQTTSLIAVLGAAGLAVGLALQGTLSNVASGVMLLVLRPFRVGQFVEIAGGKQGTVREIGLFTTIVITRDGVYVSIPNSEIFSATITNFSRERLRRVQFAVPVDRANDLERTAAVIVAALQANPLVMAEPAPSASISALQEYAAQITAYAHVRSADYWQALPALQMAVQQALNRADILLPVTRQAPVVRNEAQTPLTAPPAAPSARAADRH
jgi:small conductance mechanosensitive channel